MSNKQNDIWNENLMENQKLIEVARSFSYKHNSGNYESRDFFASRKEECFESEAEEVSQRLHEFCRKQVMKDVETYINEKARKQEQKDRGLSEAEYEIEVE